HAETDVLTRRIAQTVGDNREAHRLPVTRLYDDFIFAGLADRARHSREAASQTWFSGYADILPFPPGCSGTPRSSAASPCSAPHPRWRRRAELNQHTVPWGSIQPRASGTLASARSKRHVVKLGLVYCLSTKPASTQLAKSNGLGLPASVTTRSMSRLCSGILTSKRHGSWESRIIGLSDARAPSMYTRN